jgi:Zn-dependent peptidase ImmA (M78 family)
LTLSRIELDGIGSPTALAARIHELAPDLPSDFSIEDLCRRLDIVGIEDKPFTSIAAVLLMHPDKAWGSIVVAEGTSARRRRFSIGHELGHFLLANHRPTAGEFQCSHGDLRQEGVPANRAKKMEAEANTFAAHLLMPPARIRANMQGSQPDLAEVVRLAHKFDVSKAAMARSYIDVSQAALALVVVRCGRIEQAYRPSNFPWIAPSIQSPIPATSKVSDHGLMPGETTQVEKCDPLTWLAPSAARGVKALSEQVLAQKNDWAMVLLRAER